MDGKYSHGERLQTTDFRLQAEVDSWQFAVCSRGRHQSGLEGEGDGLIEGRHGGPVLVLSLDRQREFADEAVLERIDQRTPALPFLIFILENRDFHFRRFSL